MSDTRTALEQSGDGWWFAAHHDAATAGRVFIALQDRDTLNRTVVHVHWQEARRIAARINAIATEAQADEANVRLAAVKREFGGPLSELVADAVLDQGDSVAPGEDERETGIAFNRYVAMLWDRKENGPPTDEDTAVWLPPSHKEEQDGCP